MSSSKKLNVLSDKSREELCLSNVSQNRQSFSDRICDDLCEEILQYLSLEDKLKLEGVSKQFQRTVLKKHYKLTIENDDYIEKNVKVEYLMGVCSVYIESRFIDLKSLEVLLKKCPNIMKIELREANGRYDYNEVFRLIIKYCNNLREIVFWSNRISNENFEEFQQKFGQKINFIHRLKDANNYNLFPNIERLNFAEFGFNNSYNDLPEVIPRLKLNKLKNLVLTLQIGQEDLVKVCVDTFLTLRHFYLDVNSKNEKAIYKSFKFISNLKHLNDFSFQSSVKNNVYYKLFCDSLKTMAIKCKKLKNFNCSLFMTDSTDIRLILTSIKAFPALKRLSLRLNADFAINEVNDIFTFEAFKGLSNISHLTLEYISFDSIF